MDDLLREFLAETGEHLETVDVELVRLERDPSDAAILRNVFRLVHTIKGTCGFLGLPRLEGLAHAAETLMGQLREGKPITTDVVTLVLAAIDRIKLIIAELESLGAEPVGSDADLIAALEHASLADDVGDPIPGGQVLLRPLRPGEVPLHVLERAFRDAPGPIQTADGTVAAGRPAEAKAGPEERARPEMDGEHPSPRVQSVRVGIETLEQLMTTVSELVLTRNQLLDVARKTRDDSAFKGPLQRLSQVTAELQDGIMKTRMQPVGAAWAKLPRLLRDVSSELGKHIQLATTGADTEIDRQVLDLIRDPLTHMVRNSAAHGIESPAERLALGKPAEGRITLAAYQEGGAIAIEVSDDGRGLDYDAIRRRAREMELVSAVEIGRMTDAQVAALIFHPGFSTAEVVNSVSGRGVGMDVVKTNVELLGGTIEIFSNDGRGTTFKVKLPLTLAIVPALIVRTGSEHFAIPQVAIQELVRVRPGSDHVLEQINGAFLLRLRETLLPVIDLGRVLGLRSPTEDGAGFVVVTELGTLRFGILVEALVETEEIVVKPMCRRLKHLQLFSGNTILGDGAVALILDPNGLARHVGAKLLRKQPDAVASDGGCDDQADEAMLLVFRGGEGALKAVPLGLVARLEEIDTRSVEYAGGRATVQYRGQLMPLLPVDDRTQIRRDGVQSVIVIAAPGALLGLAVDEVVDVVRERLDIRPAPGRPDLVGTAVLRGRATEIIDMADVLPRAQDGSASAGRAGSTVLLVEDNAFFRDMLTPVLKAAGYRVRTAASADQALQAVLRHRVDVLVTDLELPDRPGLDLVEALRRHAGTRSMPVVALATRMDDRDAARAHELGVAATVSKFDRSGLILALSRATEGSCLELAA